MFKNVKSTSVKVCKIFFNQIKSRLKRCLKDLILLTEITVFFVIAFYFLILVIIINFYVFSSLIRFWKASGKCRCFQTNNTCCSISIQIFLFCESFLHCPILKWHVHPTFVLTAYSNLSIFIYLKCKNSI